MRALPFLLPLLLGACGSPPGDAPARAENGATPAGNPLPPAPATPGPTPAASPAEFVPDTPPEGTNAVAAAQLVRHYYALIGAGRYRRAWDLWANEGAASGMPAGAFADSFARYADYRAEVGEPGRVEGAAGSRYVSVPVRVYGRLRDGDRPFEMRGSVTLRRAVVDGASAEQRAWRIHDATVKPDSDGAAPPS